MTSNKREEVKLIIKDIISNESEQIQNDIMTIIDMIFFNRDGSEKKKAKLIQDFQSQKVMIPLHDYEDILEEFYDLTKLINIISNILSSSLNEDFSPFFRVFSNDLALCYNRFIKFGNRLYDSDLDQIICRSDELNKILEF